MTRNIVITVILGMAAGYFIVPDSWIQYCDTVITVGLCIILFLVGLDMGKQIEELWKDIKSVGFRVFLFPLAIIVGTLVSGFLVGLVLPLKSTESMAVAAGFGWYSLAPMMLSEYSASVSAVAFLANVIREVSAIILIPMVAKKVGFVECMSLPGAAAMDTCLPIIVSASHDRIAIYSIVSGQVLSLTVPFLLQFLLSTVLV